MAVISFVQNRLGRTDGVSLEVDKWREILTKRLGHKVWYCSGNPEVKTNHVIPELYAQHPKTWKILRNSSVEFKDYPSGADLEQDIYNHADVLEEKLLEFIRREHVNVLVPNNLCSGGYQPAAAIAFHRVFRKTGLPAIVHSHDFYFEDSGEVRPTCHTAESIYHRYFPPKLPNVQHVVINRIAQGELKRRKNIDATVVPNVFDFDQPAWVADAYNSDFRAAFGMDANDLVFLQATRILDRKGIEMAIDVVAEIGPILNCGGVWPGFGRRRAGVSPRPARSSCSARELWRRSEFRATIGPRFRRRPRISASTCATPQSAWRIRGD